MRQSKPQHGATSVHPLLRLQQCIGNRAVARLVQARLQTQPHNPTSQGQKTRKPELEFHSALHFNSKFSGFSPTAEPEEGDYGILWWSVWNTGWRSAPEHTNRLTIYNANLCSGCRKQEDEISRTKYQGLPSFPARNKVNPTMKMLFWLGLYRRDVMRLMLSSMFKIKWKKSMRIIIPRF